MIFFPDPQFFLFIPVYLAAVFFAFFVPGDLLIKRFNLGAVARVTLSTTIGICFWAIQGLFFGYLNVRNFSYLYLLVLFIFWIKSNKNSLRINMKFDFYAVLIAAIGGLAHFSSIWLMGVRQGKNLLFCCRSVPDAIYHLSLTAEIVENFPPYEPGSMGIVVKNYHYLANLVMADLIRVFHLPLVPTVYQYTPILLIVLLGFSVVTFGNLISLPKILKYLLLFTVFFAGDINFLLPLFTTGKINFAFDVFDNAGRILTGPPRIFSIIIFFCLLNLIVLRIKKKFFSLELLIAVLTGVLIGFKVYTAIPALVGLFAVIVYRLLYQHEKSGIWMFALALLIAGAIYYPVNAGVGGLIYTALWRPRDYLVRPELQLINLEYARQVYAAAGNWMKSISLELSFLFLYLIFNLGTINLSFFAVKKVRVLFPKEIFFFLFFAQIMLVILGVFFIQQTGGANTVQFLITFEAVGAILAASAAYVLFKSLPKYLSYFFLALFILLTGLRVFTESWSNYFYYQDREKVVVTYSEMDSFNYLRKHVSKDALIAVSHNLARQNTSLKVPLLSSRSVFLTGLSDHGVSGFTERTEINKKLFSSCNANEFAATLSENKIDYLYVLKTPETRDFNCLNMLEKKYENDEIIILGN